MIFFLTAEEFYTFDHKRNFVFIDQWQIWVSSEVFIHARKHGSEFPRTMVSVVQAVLCTIYDSAFWYG